MEEKEINNHLQIKQEQKNILWKKFIKERLFFLIIGPLLSIAYFIVFFLKQDIVYLYLGISVLGLLMIFLGLEVLFLMLKKERKEEEEKC